MSARTVVVSCHGGTPLSQATAEVAAELERRGLAHVRTESELEPGDDVVTLDGCSSTCVARQLAAQGTPPRISLVLEELGLDVDNVAHGLEGRGRVTLQRPERPRSASQPTGTAHTVDDYLLALDALASPVAACGALLADAPALAAHVSGLLGVSRPTAGEMLARLEGAGLVRRGPRKELLLTEPGRAAADRALRRQRLLEVFMVQTLGYSVAECAPRARALRAAFDDEALDRLRDALSAPDRCPHGWPLDPALARAESERLRSLSALEPGEHAVVARLAEDDAALVRLAELGVVCGASVEAAADGGHTVDGRPVRLSPDEIACVIVE